MLIFQTYFISKYTQFLNILFNAYSQQNTIWYYPQLVISLMPCIRRHYIPRVAITLARNAERGFDSRAKENRERLRGAYSPDRSISTKDLQTMASQCAAPSFDGGSIRIAFTYYCYYQVNDPPPSASLTLPARSLARPPGYFTIMEPRASRGTACSPPSPPPPPPPASSRSDIQAPIFTLSPAACTATKIEARPGPREWVAAIVNDRPAGRSLSDVHDAILSSPPASEDYRCPWRFLLNRFCYPAGSTREETACREY